MGLRKNKFLSDDATEKICPCCNVLKLFSEFSKNKNNKHGVNCYCKKCDNKQKKEWRSKRDNRNIVRSRNLTQSYGITIDDYDKMFQEQKGQCSICGKKETRKNMYGIRRLAVDHNHITNKVRGLLCSCCNQGLGMFYVDKKGIELLLNAVNYIRKNNG